MPVTAAPLSIARRRLLLGAAALPWLPLGAAADAQAARRDWPRRRATPAVELDGFNGPAWRLAAAQGRITGSTDGDAAGATLTAATSLVAGEASGQRSPTVAGQVLAAVGAVVAGWSTAVTVEAVGAALLDAAEADAPRPSPSPPSPEKSDVDANTATARITTSAAAPRAMTT